MNPYLRRPSEDEYTHALRLLSCPILGPEPIAEIALIGRADVSYLMIVRNELTKNGWTRPEPMNVAVQTEVATHG